LVLAGRKNILLVRLRRFIDLQWSTYKVNEKKNALDLPLSSSGLRRYIDPQWSTYEVNVNKKYEISDKCKAERSHRVKKENKIIKNRTELQNNA